jgi:hypothetical protein
MLLPALPAKDDAGLVKRRKMRQTGKIRYDKKDKIDKIDKIDKR